jgi:hypothetical protein
LTTVGLMRPLRVVALTAVLVAACGADPTPTATSGDTLTTSAGASAGTSTGTSTQRLFEPVAGPGLLDLIDRSEGRVTIGPQGSSHTALAPRGTADFHEGGLILHFDEHPDLDQIVADYRASLPNRNRGVEAWARIELPDADPTILRAALVDLVASIYLFDWALSEPACRAAVDEIRSEFRSTPPPEPRWEPQSDSIETWDYPVRTVPELPACVTDSFDDANPDGTALRLERDRAAGTLEILLDPGHYTEARFDRLLLFVVTADAPSDVAPPAPTATIFDSASMFLLAANDCGALPWAYSNFMAANSYTGPDDSSYLEPGPFTSGYACADEVPDR